MTRKQACVCGAVDCQRHRPTWGWASKRDKVVRDANYINPTYRRNRAIALEREPECHWQLPGCTLKSAQADHVVPVSRGGTNDVANLVGSCQHCNEARGRAASNAAKRRRR